jgi:hypothetical protein
MNNDDHLIFWNLDLKDKCLQEMGALGEWKSVSDTDGCFISQGYE